MKIIREQTQPRYQRFYAIKCFTCDKVLQGKSQLRGHMGHEAHYVDAEGQIDD